MPCRAVDAEGLPDFAGGVTNRADDRGVVAGDDVAGIAIARPPVDEAAGLGYAGLAISGDRLRQRSGCASGISGVATVDRCNGVRPDGQRRRGVLRLSTADRTRTQRCASIHEGHRSGGKVGHDGCCESYSVSGIRGVF